MKYIYIILTQSGTRVSKFLKFFTHKEYNHSSLALNKSLDEFYSFGRKTVNNILNGGFVIEHKNTGVFEKLPNSPCVVIEKEVTDEQYNRIETIIKKGFIENKDGEDIFVHYSAIKQDGYKTLSEGQLVEFKLIETNKGLQAINVVAVLEATV